MLTIVIPFLNEGDNLRRTLDSLYHTIDIAEFEVIVLNDASTDQFDYHRVIAGFPRIRYQTNQQRLGVSGCRELGVALAVYPAIMFLDAHMKFLQSNWASKMLAAIMSQPDHLFCTKTIAINPQWEVLTAHPVGAGCALTLDGNEPQQWLEPLWLQGPDNRHQVPCILGAVYGFQKQFYHAIGGLIGLAQWGYDEQFLSIKAFLAGGRCEVLGDICVGHLYREKQPYPIAFRHIAYNKRLCLYIAGLVNMRQINHRFPANDIFTANKASIKQLKRQLRRRLSNRSIAEYIELNQRFLLQQQPGEQQVSF